jgi:hypothetical protein
MTEDEDRERARTIRTRRALAAGAVAVGLAAVAAVAATTASRRTDDAGGTATTAASTGPPTMPGTPVQSTRRIVHEFTATYTGPVWLTVAVTDGAEHELELSWGPWRRWFRQREAGPVVYWFEKKDPVSVPVSVEVPEGAAASFGEGPLPSGAVDARPGWSRRPPSAADGAVPEPSSG